MHLFRHLSCHAVACVIVRPTPRLGRAALGRRYTWSFNPSGVRLAMSPPRPVSFYLTFSPIPRPEAWLLFSVTLLYPFGYLPVRKHGALCCPDFPPFLLERATGQPAAWSKLRIILNNAAMGAFVESWYFCLSTLRCRHERPEDGGFPI